jgi:uncharacterized membrane protein
LNPTAIVFKKYLFAGLLIWVPIAVTFWVIQMVIGMLDQTINFLPYHLRPVNTIGFHIPGLGALITLALIFITGVIAANFFGQQLVRAWDRLLDRIPFVNSVYKAVKQVSDTLLSPDGQAFNKALLVQYPRQGAWTIAFQTGTPGGDVACHLKGDFVSVYVPTTPNPTSGFFLMMPKADVIELDMSVDEALKYVISMGVVAPDAKACPPGVPPASSNPAPARA